MPLRSWLPYLLVLLCLTASLAHLRAELTSMSAAHDMVSGWDEHMQPIREALPADETRVGYLDAADIPGSAARRDSAEFLLTQYSLAPAVLEPGMGREWIVGNFGRHAAPETITAWLESQLGEYQIRDFGFGLYLIRDTAD
jgi:hypothetical protein